MTANSFSLLSVQDWFLSLVLIAPAVLLAVTFHEFAHGAVANYLGDPTAKNQGRLSLNPLRHLDPLGTLMFVLFRFGWGKPVPVDGSQLRSPRRDMVLVSLAGPLTNFAMAAGIGLLFQFWSPYGVLGLVILMIARINIILGVFNLLPFPPLDGSRLVAAVLPEAWLGSYRAVEGYGIAIIFIMIFVFPGTFGKIMGPFIDFFSRLFLV